MTPFSVQPSEPVLCVLLHPCLKARCDAAAGSRALPDIV